MQITSAKYCNDLFYYNHNRKCVCYNYNSKKRHKTKVLEFIKNNHEESKINIFLKNFNLKLENKGSSKRYLHYDIVDLDVV